MAFSVKDESSDAAVRKLAKLKNMSLTETIHGRRRTAAAAQSPCPSG